MSNELLFAAMGGNLKVTRQLIEEGANVNFTARLNTELFTGFTNLSEQSITCNVATAVLIMSCSPVCDPILREQRKAVLFYLLQHGATIESNQIVKQIADQAQLIKNQIEAAIKLIPAVRTQLNQLLPEIITVTGLVPKMNCFQVECQTQDELSLRQFVSELNYKGINAELKVTDRRNSFNFYSHSVPVIKEPLLDLISKLNQTKEQIDALGGWRTACYANRKFMDVTK